MKLLGKAAAAKTSVGGATRPPRFSLAQAEDVATGTLQFFDGFFPSLGAGGPYTVTATQALSGGAGDPSYQATQTFSVAGPEFSLDPGSVQSMYPPSGAVGVYDSVLPFIALTDATLPWERALVPGNKVPDESDPTPWLALLILKADEVVLDSTGSPLTTQVVSDFLTADPADQTVNLKPTIPTSFISSDVLSGQCQVLTVTGAAFQAVMPQSTDLPYLAHARQADLDGEAPSLVSVVIANRLAIGATGGTTYYAHLVSLEGYSPYLGPNGTALPQQTGGGTGPVNVQFASLANWTFISQPEVGASFEALMEGLVVSQGNGATAPLALPTAASGVPPQVAGRLADGYVPLSYVTGQGEQSFAWYRGPFSAVVPQPLPLSPSAAASSDALSIYLADQGLFDLSYASAWQLGRSLALQSGTFTQALAAYQQSTGEALAQLVRHGATAHLAALPPSELLRPNPNRRRFAALLAKGLGRSWHEALGRAKGGASPRTAALKRPPRAPLRPAAVKALLTRDDVKAALSAHLAPQLDAVAAGVADLAFLGSLPFSHLVPDPRMLPAESIRFFYVDAGWIDALCAGALSLAATSGAQQAVQEAVRPALDAAVAKHKAKLIRLANRGRASAAAAATEGTGTALSGFVIRSAMASGWPTLVIEAAQAGTPLSIAYRARPSADVLICVFEGVPDTVILSEPYQGLRFGVPDNGVVLRDVVNAGTIGQQATGTIPASGGYASFLTTYTTSGGDGSVVTVQALAQALAAGLLVDFPSFDTTTFGAGDFAIQMMLAPELQSFPYPAPT